jgi:hypothetical protein
MRKLALDASDPSAQPLLKEKLRLLQAPNSVLRWSWDDLAFYEIADANHYGTRLDGFRSFYSGFYRGRRAYASEPGQQYDLFDYPNFNLTVVGFSSCHNNDPLNRVGAIHPDAIAQAAIRLREYRYRNRLVLAVWHHNTSGSPLQFDYMDPTTLQILIDNGFSIGFHGHQHKEQFIDEKFAVGESRKITVISAGTLCAGPSGLPSGYSRAYNLLELDTVALTGRLHLRHMHNETFGSPVWGPGFFRASLKTYIDFRVQGPVSVNPHSKVPDLDEAERLIGNKEYRAAATILELLAEHDQLAKRMLLECYVRLDDNNGICRIAFPPTSTQEAIYLMDALWSKGQRDVLMQVLSSDIVTKANDPGLVDLAKSYARRLST